MDIGYACIYDEEKGYHCGFPDDHSPHIEIVCQYARISDKELFYSSELPNVISGILEHMHKLLIGNHLTFLILFAHKHGFMILN